jgi:hypothetical protein
MEPASIAQIQLDIGNASESIIFRSSCSKVEFLGYQAVYEDPEAKAIKNNDNDQSSEREETFKTLSSLKVPFLSHFFFHLCFVIVPWFHFFLSSVFSSIRDVGTLLGVPPFFRMEICYRLVKWSSSSTILSTHHAILRALWYNTPISSVSKVCIIPFQNMLINNIALFEN